MASEGKCRSPKPGKTDLVGKAKWEAPNSSGGGPPVEAPGSTFKLVNNLVSNRGLTQSKQYSQSIQVTKLDGVCTLLLNRPEKMNALDMDMYKDWVAVLEDAAQDKTVKLVVITGAGKYFCSGNDLSNFAPFTDSLEEMMDAGEKSLNRFIDAFIDFPKPLIAAVNGPAVGIAVTTLALYDIVFAADDATFSTPFTQLGQTPEGCSSVTFPTMMGRSHANRMLLFGEKLTAHEAEKCGLVTRVFPRESFELEVQNRIKSYSELPYETLLHSKRLLSSYTKEQLHQVNRIEAALLKERWVSPDCLNSVANFLQKKKSKL